MTLTLEEFAAKCLWEEYMRLFPMLGEYYAKRHFKNVLRRIRRADYGLERNGHKTEWGAMVDNWYARYLQEQVHA